MEAKPTSCDKQNSKAIISFEIPVYFIFVSSQQQTVVRSSILLLVFLFSNTQRKTTNLNSEYLMNEWISSISDSIPQMDLIGKLVLSLSLFLHGKAESTRPTMNGNHWIAKCADCTPCSSEIERKSSAHPCECYILLHSTSRQWSDIALCRYDIRWTSRPTKRLNMSSLSIRSFPFTYTMACDLYSFGNTAIHWTNDSDYSYRMNA